MLEQNTSLDEIMIEIYRAIYSALESKMHLIGSVIDRDARREIMAQNIYDKGDFYNNAGYIVEKDNTGMTLRVGSNVKHELYVLGGKVPSWTPIAPLISWVQRKGLAWVDKKTGAQLKVEQMAYMIRGKIRREGIAARNVYETVLQNKEAWIFEQLNSIEVRI
ncbi:MAG: hypothetical protein BWY95_00236 [Bacteroidetes bacterium ADurb.BinA104]|jgi:hypothetical protein|nr:MAG: hypothetical protein BWY95_00236 [Bacteroidetes bacterium ADurb.BinA104]